MEIRGMTAGDGFLVKTRGNDVRRNNGIQINPKEYLHTTYYVLCTINKSSELDFRTQLNISR